MPDKNLATNKIVVEIRKSGMEAWLKLMPQEGETIEQAEIMDAIASAKVTYGIFKDVIKSIDRNLKQNQEILIAKGLEPVNGTDGNFEYFFDRTVYSKPRILEDGSVDYYCMTRIVTVSAGDKIIEYHPATKGTDGMDVSGQTIKAVSGKELGVIKGKGFSFSEDRTIYTALLTGKIEYKDDRLMISNTWEVKDDIDYLQGDIHFKGDLVIYGNIAQGKVVEADGCITIRGHVEAATIIAGKDIVFESGMQGAQKGVIISGGNVSGKFFEQVNIKAKGDVTANAIMNCNIEAGQNVIVTGSRGVLISGFTHALKTIKASIVGNDTWIKTSLSVGVPDSITYRVKNIESKIAQRTERLSQIEAALAMIAERDVVGHKNPFETQKLQLLRTKISTNTEIAEFNQERDQLVCEIETSKGARIEIEKIAYPQTTLSINGIVKTIDEETTKVAFYRKENEIETQIL